MKKYDRCGLYKCGEFGTSIPSDVKGVTLFKAYLKAIGHPEGNRLTKFGNNPKLYTIDFNSGNRNTEMKIDDSFDTILIGVRNGDVWTMYELKKSDFEKEKERNVVTLSQVERLGRKINA